SYLTCSEDSGGYRYGYSGQEKINEWAGIGNNLDFEYRGYDPRIARFYSEDPITSKYPMLTPYQFASNNPIAKVEIEGLEGEWKVSIQQAQKDMEAALKKGSSHDQARKVYNQTLNSHRLFGSADLDPHLTLDVLGLVPLIGEWADGIN